jgi:mRNA interferase RelE/StbE
MTDPDQPSYALGYSPAAIRNLQKPDTHVRRIVYSDIEKLKEDPRPSGVEKLRAEEKLYRVRVGPGKDYRVICQIRDKALMVLVVKIGDRKDVYRRLG